MPEVFRQYQSSLLCVLPFTGSFAGLAAATAAAVGLPVIATKNAGIPEHIGENGIWIDNDNAEEIAAQIEKTSGLRGTPPRPLQAPPQAGGTVLELGRCRRQDIGGL